MIHSFIFSGGKVVSENLDLDALRLVKGDKGLLIWVDLDQPTPEEARLVLEDIFRFHPLAIEDCLEFRQFPKLEDYETFLFLILHAVGFDRKDKFSTNEMDMFLGRDFLVTHHTDPLAPIQLIQERFIKKTASPVRGSDLLAHMVLDALISRYHPVLDELTAELDELEDLILEPRKHAELSDILSLRQDLSFLRRLARPQRDIMLRLSRGESRLIRTKLLPYYRDLFDELTRIDDAVGGFTERLMLDFDVYMNRSSNEVNEGIKVLTSLTALTIPPMVIAAWYGMNFKHMPELDSPYAYWIVLGVTLLSMLAMWVWLRARNWF